MAINILLALCMIIVFAILIMVDTHDKKVDNLLIILLGLILSIMITNLK
ncbi:hypothetical protein LCFBJUUZ_CDS0096 [Staphylococcus phage PG-2021_76]|uniref:Uncharacterized protein n=1 Tax=Mammaliicoccus phage MSShimriz1 TaxID=3230127 RepID=A0AAU8GTI0_9VIRU